MENSTNDENEESDNVSNKDADKDFTTERLSGNGRETASTCEPVVNGDTSKRKGKNKQPDQVGVFTIKRAGCLMPLLISRKKNYVYLQIRLNLNARTCGSFLYLVIMYCCKLNLLNNKK